MFAVLSTVEAYLSARDFGLIIYLALVFLVSSCSGGSSELARRSNTPLPLETVGVPLTPQLETFISRKFCRREVCSSEGCKLEPKQRYDYMTISFSKINKTIWDVQQTYRRGQAQVTFDPINNMIVITRIDLSGSDRFTGQKRQTWSRDWFRIISQNSIMESSRSFSYYDKGEYNNLPPTLYEQRGIYQAC